MILSVFVEDEGGRRESGFAKILLKCLWRVKVEEGKVVLLENIVNSAAENSYLRL